MYTGRCIVELLTAAATVIGEGCLDGPGSKLLGRGIVSSDNHWVSFFLYLLSQELWLKFVGLYSL